MKKLLGVPPLLLGFILSVMVISTPTAAQSNSGFSLQVTPSPLITTLKPGQKTELELKIRNAGTSPEQLKIEPRSFTLGNNGADVKLNDTTPPDIATWISFSNPSFTIQPGQWYTQKVRFAVPKDTGFSYSFALVITRKNAPTNTQGTRALEGSVAVFTLVNIDRPGAVRKLDVASFQSTKRVYEYVPSEFTLRLKNTGNSIVQPYGNIYIQRKSNDTSPIATLPVNEKKGYILPSSMRSLSSTWNSGFPVYRTYSNSSGEQKRSVSWNWKNIADFRIGKYTAKLVAVYNDGQRDVPLEAEVSFWVIPWKIIAGFIVVSILALLGLWSAGRKLLKLLKKLRKKQPPVPAEKA